MPNLVMYEKLYLLFNITECLAAKCHGYDIILRHTGTLSLILVIRGRPKGCPSPNTPTRSPHPNTSTRLLQAFPFHSDPPLPALLSLHKNFLMLVSESHINIKQYEYIQLQLEERQYSKIDNLINKTNQLLKQYFIIIYMKLKIYLDKVGFFNKNNRTKVPSSNQGMQKYQFFSRKYLFIQMKFDSHQSIQTNVARQLMWHKRIYFTLIFDYVTTYFQQRTIVND